MKNETDVGFWFRELKSLGKNPWRVFLVARTWNSVGSCLVSMWKRISTFLLAWWSRFSVKPQKRYSRTTKNGDTSYPTAVCGAHMWDARVLFCLRIQICTAINADFVFLGNLNKYSCFEKLIFHHETEATKPFFPKFVTNARKIFKGV